MATVGKLVVLKLDGEFEREGFRVTLEIGLEGERPHTEVTGLLPPDPQLMIDLNEWQKQYRRLGEQTRIKPKEIIYEGSVNYIEECRQSAQQLGDRLSCWLESESFRPLDKRLREELNRNEPIRLLIRTQDRQLSKLPWNLWDFLERYQKAEVALAAPACERVETAHTASECVRILAILGHSKGIDTEADRRILEALPDAEVEFLIEPNPQQLNDRLWEQPWDILFFAGHSETEEDRGRIYINPQDSLTIDELKYGLRKAIASGLQLAIFNSCDGLGLAHELEQLHLPQIIVMREPVPDKIAQEFLKYFLDAFSRGKSLYAATRQARERLQGWEHNFPCASWLPVIYQNPAAVPPDWQALQHNGSNRSQEQSGVVSKLSWRGIKTALVASVVVTSIVMGVRSLGLLQASELKNFDLLTRLKPAEAPDKRILVVTVDEADIQYQQRMGMNLRGSLSDPALSQLIRKIAPHQPKVIASDVVHDFPFEPDLATTTKQTEQFIALCRVSNPQTNLISISPPPGIPIKQLGFSNVVLDPDDIVRRQILGMSPDKTCQSDQSFSFRTALRYLDNLPVQNTPEGIHLGNVVFKQLEANSGGYQLPQKEVLGYQILLNYRSSTPQQVPLREIISGERDAQLASLVKDRIVLIGVTRENQDLHSTPYSRGMTSKIPGVFVHAQMISGIISGVLDQRPLLWWWNQWGETLWIGSWSIVGGVLVLVWRSPKSQALAIIIACGVLSGSCFVLFLQGGWTPLVPSALTLIATGGSVVVYNIYRARRQHKTLNSYDDQDQIAFPSAIH